MSGPDNPPAFPRTLDSDEVQFCSPQTGMSLRDYFAGQALAGFCSQCDAAGSWSWLPEDAVAESYRVSDAMLAERAKGGTQ